MKEEEMKDCVFDFDRSSAKMEQKLSRRMFVTIAGAAGAVAACASSSILNVAMADSSKSVASEIESWDYETDIVVCGSGAGGSATAVESADQGCDVIIVEKRDWCGGQLRRSGGGFAAAGTPVQEKLGVTDSVDQFYDYVIACADGSVDPDLVKTWVNNATDTFNWLIDTLGAQPVDEWEFDSAAGDMGVENYSFGPGLSIGTEPSNYIDRGFEPVARCHWFSPYEDDPFIGDESKHLFPKPGGTGLWHVMDLAIQDRENIQVMTETSLVRLVTADDSNEVIGIVAQQGGEEIYIKARKAVMVCTGNFASNHEMWRNYTGWDFEASVNGGNAEDIEDDNDGVGVNTVLALGGALEFPYKGPKNPSYDNKCALSYLGGGLKVDTSSRAVDAFGNIIPRLYIGGIASAGYVGENYPHCGCNISHSMTMGRLAAQDAATLDNWE